MELSQINQRIAVVNAESKRLNNERAVNIGKRETLEKQLADAIALYNSTYNTSITADDLGAEIQRVASEKEREVSNIENMLNLIKSGQFEEAQNMAVNGVVEEEVPNSAVNVGVEGAKVAVPSGSFNGVVPSPAPSGVANGVASPAPSAAPSGVALTEVASAPNAVPNLGVPSQSGVAPSQAPSAVPNLGAPSPAQPPKTPELSSLDVGQPVAKPTQLSGLDIDEEPVGKPPVLGKPPVAQPPKTPVNIGEASSQGAPITSFNAILGGSQFKPQGNS